MTDNNTTRAATPSVERHSITGVRRLTDQEFRLLDWHRPHKRISHAVELDDDRLIVAAADSAARRPGFLKGAHKAPEELVDVEIIATKPLDQQTIDEYGWTIRGDEKHPTVLVLDNRRTIFPLCNENGQGPGALLQVDTTTDRVYRVLHDAT
jgi:hypothetical protein